MTIRQSNLFGSFTIFVLIQTSQNTALPEVNGIKTTFSRKRTNKGDEYATVVASRNGQQQIDLLNA